MIDLFGFNEKEDKIDEKDDKLDEESNLDSDIAEDVVMDDIIDDSSDDNLDSALDEIKSEEIMQDDIIEDEDVLDDDDDNQLHSETEAICLEDDNKLLEIIEQHEAEKNSFKQINISTPIIQPSLDNFQKSEIDNVVRPDINLNLDNFGITLKQLRVSSDLSLDILSQQTCINKNYLEALENEDYDSLPAEVYIIAYIRKLSMIYHLEEFEIEALTKKVKEKMDKHLDMEINDSPDKMILGFEPSNENAEKLKEIFWSITIILIIVAIIIFSVLLYLKKHNQSSNGDVETSYSTPAFRSEEVLDVQKTPKLNNSYLEIP